RGTEHYFEDKLHEKNVLIGAVRNKEQLDVYLQHNLYFMPLAQLGKDQNALTQLHVIGLYQSRAQFGQQECGIRWIGRVRNWSVVARSAITELPIDEQAEDVLFLRIEIESWVERECPIEPGGRRVSSYLLTSEYMLERAHELHELRFTAE
ncbi:MAG: hypothetical protein ACXVPK_07710, partial [Tumebacillaceae bacterium]